jgi:hypothetical protein
MKELFMRLKPFAGSKGIILDTCAIFNSLDHHYKLNSLPRQAIITSFTMHELLYKEHDVDEKVRQALRNWLKGTNAQIYPVPCTPGDREGEKQYVRSVDPRLLEIIPDPSDAVLLAAAIETRSDVFTKDRHHLYTAALGNYAKEWNIRVWKELKDVV